MKRLFGVFLTVLILYAVYVDLSHGTLPTNETPKIEAKAVNPTPNTAYFEVVVKPGDTVLSIIESELDMSIPVPISQVIEDFQALNEGLNPEQIQIGKPYKFPKYEATSE